MKNKPWNHIEEFLSVAALVLILILLSWQVFARGVLNRSNAWSEETSRYLLVWFVYLSASFAVLKKAHIRIDATQAVFPVKIRKYVNIVGQLVFLAYCIAMIIYGAQYAYQTFLAGQVTVSLRIPMVFVTMSVAVCHCFMLIRSLQVLFEKDPQKQLSEVDLVAGEQNDDDKP